MLRNVNFIKNLSPSILYHKTYILYSGALSHSLSTQTDFVVVSMVRELVQVNVIRPLGQEGLQILQGKH